MSRLLVAVARWMGRRVCLNCDGWIWRRGVHRFSHPSCAHMKRLQLQAQTDENYGDLAPQWASPCPDCGAVL